MEFARKRSSKAVAPLANWGPRAGRSLALKQMTPENSSAPIESYGLIGDCETAALVGLDGSIDWLCWPNFSSEACFARLLGSADNGRWMIRPAGSITKTSRQYRAHTLILETTFKTAKGSVALIDFMPIRGENSDVVRIVKGLSGEVEVEMDLVLRFGYGRIVPWVTQDKGWWKAVAGPDMAIMRTEVPLTGRGFSTVSRFTVKEGDCVDFAMTYGRSYHPPPRVIDVQKALQETQEFWEKWSSGCSYDGPYVKAVERSLITLKALIYRPTGGIVAAVTTSLPEHLGGNRNWDYRYCWLRDTTFTLLALMNGGHFHEAKDWMKWLQRAIAGAPDQVQIMYGIAGERDLRETEVPWLSGYAGSKPVRLGNAASEQLQLDIYGEVMDAFSHALKRLGEEGEPDFHMLQALMDHLEKIWEEPDEGIWETRGGRRHFTYSKVMAWVAFDRAIQVAEKLGVNAPTSRWKEVRSTIHNQVCDRGYNKKLGSFTQAYGSRELDASLLLLPMVGFLSQKDPRMEGTVRAIEQRLMRNGLVMRYDTGESKDGLPPGEGYFLACSFWMVSNYKLMGRDEDARQLFERLLSLANDVGLLAEEYDVAGKRQLGNFPQALSHIALVNAAFDLLDHNGSSNQRSRGSARSHQTS